MTWFESCDFCLIPKVTCSVSVSVLFSLWCIFHCVRTWWAAWLVRQSNSNGRRVNWKPVWKQSCAEIHTSSLTRQLRFTCQNATRSGLESQSEGNVFRECIHHKCDCNARPNRSRFDSTVEWFDSPSSTALPDIQAVDALERCWEKGGGKLGGRSFQSSISLEIRSYLCFVYMSLSHTLSLYKLKHSFFTLSFPTGEDLRVFSSSYLVATSLFVLRVCFLESKRVLVYNCVSSVSFTGSRDGSVPYYMPGPVAFVLRGSPPTFGLWI